MKKNVAVVIWHISNFCKSTRPQEDRSAWEKEEEEVCNFVSRLPPAFNKRHVRVHSGVFRAVSDTNTNLTPLRAFHAPQNVF